MVRFLVLFLLFFPFSVSAERIKAEPELLEFVVKLVHHESDTSVREAYVSMLEKAGQKNVHRFAKKQQGFAVWLTYSDRKVCEVHYVPAKDTNDRYRMAVLGHEVEHCSRGEYHSDAGE